MSHSGSCLCGGVRYALHGDLGLVTLCHCRQCRKAQGGAAVAASFMAENLADRLVLFASPRAIGAENAVPSPLDPAVCPGGFRLERRSQFGEDTCFEYVRA